jgi:hypothetical protein
VKLTKRIINAWLASVLSLAVVALVPTAQAQKWVQEQPLTPEARFYHTAVLDPTTDVMIIFGGAGAFVHHNDVWILTRATGPEDPDNLSSWAQLQPAGTSPAPRIYHSAVYDQTSNRMTIFGGGLGNSSPCANDVWVLDNANGTGGTPTWTSISTSGTPPSPRGQHAAIYDASSNRMTIFGGQDCFSTLFNDTWVLTNANGLGGAPTWIQLATAGTPPSPREIGNVGYDPATNRMIVFGGASTGGSLADVWVLTNANGLGGTPTWIQLSPSGAGPAARSTHSTVYDPATNTLIIFGGEVNPTFFGDTWALSNANGIRGTPTWTQIMPSGTFPIPRAGHTAVYDPVSNRMTVFGGLICNVACTSLVVNDVFVLTRASGKAH